MRYVRVNDRDYVKVRDDAPASRIIAEWLRGRRNPFSASDVAGWQILRLNANGTATVLAHHEVPAGYADFNLIEIGDNA